MEENKSIDQFIISVGNDIKAALLQAKKERFSLPDDFRLPLMNGLNEIVTYLNLSNSSPFPNLTPELARLKVMLYHWCKDVEIYRIKDVALNRVDYMDRLWLEVELGEPVIEAADQVMVKKEKSKVKRVAANMGYYEGESCIKCGSTTRYVRSKACVACNNVGRKRRATECK